MKSHAITDDERRKLWRKHFDESEQAWQPWLEGRLENYPRCLPMPAILIGLTCGAQTRKGTPCKRTDIFRSGRCKYHGGRSTGPKTEEGKMRSAQNLQRKNPLDIKQD